jgi:hypothetical protein
MGGLSDLKWKKCIEHLQIGKLKVNLTLGLVKHHAVKTYGDVEI